MHEVKFIEFKSTPEQKHIGIATVLIDGMIYLRYKMSPGKNGGHFPNAPSYKITEYGSDTYIAGFVIESAMLKETIESTIKSNVGRILEAESGQPTYRKPAQTQSSNDMVKAVKERVSEITQMAEDCPF